MRRREFIALFGGAAAGWPLAATAQQPATPVVGFLGGESPDLYADRLRGFRQGLSESGYAEDRNVAVEYRWAEGRNDRLPALAADLARRDVRRDRHGWRDSRGVGRKRGEPDDSDRLPGRERPVQLGLVASLNRPGGNITGVNSLNAELGPKLLELLHEILPTASTICYPIRPDQPRQSRHTKKPGDCRPFTRSMSALTRSISASARRKSRNWRRRSARRPAR